MMGDMQVKLYIKQKVWSWKDRFTIKDPDGHDRYAVEGEFSLWRKLHVYDMDGREVIRIEQKHWTMMPCFQVYIGDQQAAEVKQKFSWTHPRYEIIGPDWTVEGNWHGHDYEVTSPTQGCIVRIAKEWMTWGDSYKLDVADPADELLALAVVLAIDCAVSIQNSN